MSDEAALPRPNGICPACQVAAPSLKHDASGRLAVYCEHNQAGAVLAPIAGGGSMWTIFTPTTREDFVESVLKFAERYRDAFGSGGAPLQ